LSIVTTCGTTAFVLIPARHRIEGNVVARKRRHSSALRPPYEVVQIGVRLTDGLRRRLERVAAQRGQSMNAEIVERLQRSFQSDEDTVSLLARAVIDAYPDVADRIEEIFAELRREDALADAAMDSFDEERIERERDDK
jgi:plasmid stability protein